MLDDVELLEFGCQKDIRKVIPCRDNRSSTHMPRSKPKADFCWTLEEVVWLKKGEREEEYLL